MAWSLGQGIIATYETPSQDLEKNIRIDHILIVLEENFRIGHML